MPEDSASRKLSAIADRYRAALAGGDLREVDLTPYDRTGVPGIGAVWGVGAGTEHGTGFGATPEAATVGGLGELAEAVLMNPAVAALPRRRGSYAELRAELGAARIADPVTLTLPAGSDYSPRRPLDWVPMQRWRTGEDVLVPVEFVASAANALPADPPPGGWLTTAVTNGLGAGDSLTRAVSHGILEIVQRDGDTVSYRALDTGVVVDLASCADPDVQALLERYRAVGIEPMIKLASTEFAVVVYCVGIDSDPDTPPLTVTAMGEAAALDAAGAVTKALLEYGSSRERKVFSFGPLDPIAAREPDYFAREMAEPLGPQEPRALREMTEWTTMTAAQLSDLVAPTLYRVTETVPFDALPSVPKPDDPAGLLDVMLDRLEDFDVLVTPAHSEAGDMCAAKVVVPGLEVETLSYLRIGERVLRRLLERGPDGVGGDLVGRGAPTTADQLPIHLTPEATERVGGPAWLDRAAVQRTLGALYPLYREPDRWAIQRLAAGR